MRATLFLLLLLVSIASGAELKKACSPTQLFWTNVNRLFIDPVVDRVNHVMYSSPETILEPIHTVGFMDVSGWNLKCPDIGINSGLDVLVVYFKMLTSVSLSFLPISDALRINIQTLNMCNHISSIQNLPEDYVASTQCKVATDLFRCSMLNMWAAAGWLICIMIAIVILFSIMACAGIVMY